jgi:tetratricopeptide (TPR) repeat protein
MRQGELAAARSALAAAKDVSAGLSEREASHIGFFDLVFAGQTDAAVAALYAHLAASPCDALVVSAAANPNGLIGGSGRVGQKHQIAELMDSLAPHYGDDFWFVSYHAMALSEDGQLAAARTKIERSVATNPNNAHAAHGFAHVCYESGELDTARTYLSSWLATYPRDGFFYGHLSWHLSLCEIQAGNWAEALRLYRDAIALARHSGGPQQKYRTAQRSCGAPSSPAIRAMFRPGAACTNMRTAHCRGQATGLPIYTSVWPRPSSVMMPSLLPEPGRWMY